MRGRRGADNKGGNAIELTVLLGVFVAYGLGGGNALGVQGVIRDAKLNEFPRDTIGATLAKIFIGTLGAGSIAMTNDLQARDFGSEDQVAQFLKGARAVC
jgi:hypothetical protein